MGKNLKPKFKTKLNFQNIDIYRYLNIIRGCIISFKNVHKFIDYDRKTIINYMKITYFMIYIKISFKNKKFKNLKITKNYC